MHLCTYSHILCCVVLCCVVLCCVVLCCVVLCCLVLSCLVLSCLVLSCLVLSCLVLSCLVLSEYRPTLLVESKRHVCPTKAIYWNCVYTNTDIISLTRVYTGLYLHRLVTCLSQEEDLICGRARQATVITETVAELMSLHRLVSRGSRSFESCNKPHN